VGGHIPDTVGFPEAVANGVAWGACRIGIMGGMGIMGGRRSGGMEEWEEGGVE